MVHTDIYTKDGVTVMKYHNTSVARFAVLGNDPTKVEVMLNTGGFFTKTTKKRMNQFADMFGLGFRVFVSNFTWYVNIDSKQPVKDFEGNTCSFTASK